MWTIVMDLQGSCTWSGPDQWSCPYSIWLVKASTWASGLASQCIRVTEGSAICLRTSERTIDSRVEVTLPGTCGVQLERSVDAMWWKSWCQDRNLGSTLQEVASHWKFWSKEVFSKWCFKKIHWAASFGGRGSHCKFAEGLHLWERGRSQP